MNAPSTTSDAAASDGGALDTFTRYLGDLQAHSLLDAATELDVARALEQHEVAHWSLLLGIEDLRPAILDVFERDGSVPSELADLPRDASAEARNAAAERLRKLPAKLLSEVDEVARRSLQARGDRDALLDALTRERKAHLAAKHRLVTANLRLVVALARRYPRGLLPLSDLVQEGNLGLLRAVETFDYKRGFRFSTYAAWWIRHAFNRGLSDRGRLVRMPVHAFEDAQRVDRARKQLGLELGSEPTAEALADKAGLPLERVLPFSEGFGRSPVSLDKTLRDDGDATLLDMLPAVGPELDILLDVARWERTFAPLMQALTPLEAEVLRLRFGFEGEELTLREIGEKHQLTRERIRQLQEQALQKLRSALRSRESAA